MMGPALVFVFALVLGAPQEQTLAPEMVQREGPAPGPYPDPPAIAVAEEETGVDGLTLESNGALAGRLSIPGESVTLELPGKAGDFFLLECNLWGVARGTETQARMGVTDGEGQVLAECVMAGKTLHQGLMPVTLAGEGPFRLEVEGIEGVFRFVLVRHGDYRNAQVDRDLGMAQGAQGWLPGGEYQVPYLVRGKPGSVLVLSVEPTQARGRAMHRKRRLLAPEWVAQGRSVFGEGAVERFGVSGEEPYPDFVLGLYGKDGVLSKELRFHRQVTVPESGMVRIAVMQNAVGGQGAGSGPFRFDRGARLAMEQRGPAGG